MAASPELLRHLALRRAASAMASAIMDGEYDDQDDAVGTDAATLESVRQQNIATSQQAQAANPALSVVAKSEHETNMAWLRKSMSNTKESIWSQIQAAAAADPATNGLGLTVEQAISKFLGTSAGSALYTAWTKAPLDASAGSPSDVQKAEGMGAPRGTSQVRRSAADEAELERMGREAEAQIAGK